MDKLRQAMRSLIQSGKIVEQDAFQLLKTIQDPLEVTSHFLEKYPKKSNVSKSDLLTILRQPIQTSSIHHDQIDIPKEQRGNIPRRHRTRKLSHKAILTRPPNSEQLQTNQHNVIRTKFDDLQGLNNYEPDFKVVFDPNIESTYKGTIDNLVQYFQSRFQKLSSLFRGRVDINNIRKIKDLQFMRDLEEVSVIGMIIDKKFKTEGGGSITIEDPISDKTLNVILPSNNKILTEKCVQLMNDTVICAIGFYSKDNLIANDVILPDIPNLRKKHSAPIPVHAAFLSDIHIGSKNFLETPMENFVKLLNGEFGNRKMKALGEQTKYILFGGDVVDGVGIYPNQLGDLAIDNIKEQYELFAGYLERFPEDVQVVIIPGNHDMVRNAEPQPKISGSEAEVLVKMRNVHLLANPSQVSIHSVQVLLYHCTSIPDIMNSIPGVPSDQPVEVMKHMLKARHLAPIWGAKTPIAAESEDHLVIEKVPDIFHGGHMHINGEAFYKGVQIINSGTMQNQTSFQKSLNIIPTPGQLSITNLKSMNLNRINLLD